MQINLYKGDLPNTFQFGPEIAVDVEMMGLNLYRDRVCLVQIKGENEVALVQILPAQDCPNLKKLLTNPQVLKIFHYARGDVAKLYHDFGVMTAPIYCTKIASKIARTFCPAHGLKDVCWDLLGIKLDKELQTSDWGKAEISPEQQKYAAADVLYLHEIKEKLDIILKRENRYDLTMECFKALPVIAKLDNMEFDISFIFNH